MGRKKLHRREEELKEYNARRQREYHAKHRERRNARYMELYYENKEMSKVREDEESG